jgi:hypothetical protein
MKKTSKPVPKTPAKKAPAIKQSSAKPKAKSSVKSKPRKAQGQAELLSIIERLAQAAERLAQAAEWLAEAAVPAQTVGQQQHDCPGQPAELLADLTAPGESVADLTAPAVDMPVDDTTGEE